MQSLHDSDSDSLVNFKRALKMESSVTLDKQGNWKVQGYLGRAYSWIGGSDRKNAQVIEAFSARLDHEETVPVNLYSPTDYSQFIKTANILKNKFTNDTGPRTRRALHELIQRIQGLRYRVEECKPKTNIDKKQYICIADLILDWKENTHSITYKAITEFDQAQVTALCQHPKIATLVEQNTSIREAFFKWSIRAHLSVDLFVQYPRLRAHLSRYYLDQKISSVSADLLKISISDQGKVVTLRVEDRDLEVNNPNRVHRLSNGYELTVHQIFSSFRDCTISNLNFSEQGVINWSCTALGPFNPTTRNYEGIDLNSERWWESLPQLPPVTTEYMKQVFGRSLAQGEYAIGALASTPEANPNTLRGHGWLVVFIPTKNGQHRMLPFGKYPKKFPNSVTEWISLLAGTQPAIATYPDESTTNISRLAKGYLRLLNEGDEELQTLMGHIASDLQEFQVGQHVFQFVGDNCCTWVQSIFDRMFRDAPRLYDRSYWDYNFGSLGGFLLRSIKKIPSEKMRRLLLRIGLSTLGGEFKTVTIYKQRISLFTSTQWQAQTAQSPAQLVQNFEQS